MRLLLWVAVLASIGPFPSAGAQSPLDREAAHFAEAWSDKDIGLLGDLMAPEGIRLHLPGEDHPSIRPRQAQAAIRGFLGRYGEGEVQVSRVSPTSGDPGRGFAEIRWTTGSPEVSKPVIFTLFVAFALRGGAWAVTEIRVLF